jgi:hypothetical protein
VRQILGFLGHFQDYIPDFAKLAKPLTDLTGKRYSHRIPWGQLEQSAFEELKSRLIKATIEPIGTIDCKNPFLVMVDSCDYGVGGIFAQTDDNNASSMYLSLVVSYRRLNDAGLLSRRMLCYYLVIKKVQAVDFLCTYSCSDRSQSSYVLKQHCS